RLSRNRPQSQVVALRRSYSAFNAALGDLYADDLLTLASASDKPDFDDTAFFDAAGMVYRAGGFDPSQLSSPEARRLIAETLSHLRRAIDSGVPHEVPEVVRHALENNAFIFSGFKAYHSLREVGLSLTTDKGEIKPFEQFHADVQKVNNQYNHNYLYAEYNHAVGASLMASRWQQIEADGDRYDLQYRTAQDDRVREDHAILHGTTLPPSDPFWSLYLPPNGWNCRCTAVQVRKGKYPTSDPALSMLRGNNCTEAAKQQIFRFNPGKSLELFPPKHPYYKGPKPEQLKNAIEGYTPVEWTPTTVAEAEQFFRDNLGVNCSLKGFTKNDLELVQSLFRSVERHFQCYPELKKVTLFVGSIQGRVQLLAEAKYEQEKAAYPHLDEATLRAKALTWAKSVAQARSCYAYSHSACADMGLSGIAWATAYRGEKFTKAIEHDVKTKFSPVGTASAKAVVDHELGHEIDRLLGLRTHAEFLKLYNEVKPKGKEYIRENLSGYADKNPAEFIAEAWSEYLNNETPRPIAVAVGNLIKKLYAEKHQSSGSST
ncbi:MAG: phage minor head protein, partial [Lachnospiraceae bacterium]|nr:phage minor head protein [Lachnospiraceae bacterium]